MTRNNNFKLIFKDKHNNEITCDYRLYDSIVADKWIKKIKHLKNLPIDKIESKLIDLHNVSLKDTYMEFCRFAEITPINFSNIDQNLLNQLHKIYEQSHKIFSTKSNNSILYKFHHSIHFHEARNPTEKQIDVGWGTKEGPLTENFNCNQYYEKKILKNNLYLPWSELGKKPLTYWENLEPNDQTRFNELAKPHVTFRAKFFIATKNITPTELKTDFVNWFEIYKNNWFEHHNINKWDHIDEHSAPLLAIADHTEDLKDCKFMRIEL